MATTKLYLDTRGKEDNDPAPLKVCITNHGKSTYISLEVKLPKSQWDAEKQKVKNTPNNVLGYWLQLAQRVFYFILSSKSL